MYHQPIQQTLTQEKPHKTSADYREENRSIEVTIKNQPFTPYANADDKTCNLYYTVQIKGHFEEDTKWNTFQSNPYDSWFFIQSSSEYTVKARQTSHVEGSQLDFRVQAFTGYWGEPTLRICPQ
jgi:hypothetical protein